MSHCIHNIPRETCQRCEEEATLRTYNALVTRAELANKLTPSDAHRLRMAAIRQTARQKNQ